MAKILKQKVTFKVSPDVVYETLMDSKKHSQMTGGKASISQKVAGKFSAYDGYIVGTNLKLIPGKKIVQSWRGSDWPDGVYSTLTFDLKKVAGGTELSMTQVGVPIESQKSISQGWKDYYWTPMKAMFAGK